MASLNRWKITRAIGILRNTGTDPHRELDPRPSSPTFMTNKKLIKKRRQDPLTEFSESVHARARPNEYEQ